MNINNYKEESLILDQVPQFSCPKCFKGILEKTSVDVEDTADCIVNKRHPEFGEDMTDYLISLKLTCNNKQCTESVVMVGSGFTERNHEFDRMYDDLGQEFYTYFKAVYSFPHLKIFNIPATVPDDITTMIDKSFPLYLCDEDSCANRLRASIELILDDDRFESPRTIKSKSGKDQFNSLGNRIHNLSENHKDIKDLLNAIRWFGNVGSHGTGSITKKKLIQGYEIIERICQILFPIEEDYSHIAKKAQEMTAEFKPATT